MKYRLLNTEELKPLQEEFLKYLLVANVTPQKWEVIKQHEPQLQQDHLEVFSDLVLDKILSDVVYVDVVLENRVQAFHFMETQVLMFSLENKILNTFDFIKDNWSGLNILKTNLVQGKKEYIRTRNEEVFSVLQLQNAFMSKGELYKKIVLLSVEIS
jgi:hypothetical protein